MPVEPNSLRVAQSVAVVRQLPMIIVGNGVGSTIGCLALAAAGVDKSLWPLGGGIWILLLPMIASWLKLRNLPLPTRVSKRRINIITVHSGVLGCGWAGLELWYLFDVSFAVSAFLMAACAFLAVGSVTAVFVIPRASIAYAAPMMAAAIFISVQSNDPQGPAFAALLLLMSVGMVWFLKVNWEGFLAILALSSEKNLLLAQLAADLQRQKELVVEKEEAKAALRRANESLLSMTQTDSLTGLANRRGFDSAIRTEWLRSQRLQSNLSVLMVDVDRFKEINDRFGHAAGDSYLRMVANALEGSVRGTGTIARYGGDEFAVLLPEADRDDATQVAARICENVAAESPQYPLSVSIGIASSSVLRTFTASEILERADTAMYRAKLEGRNRYLIASDEE